jgi:hypothetical protein
MDGKRRTKGSSVDISAKAVIAAAGLVAAVVTAVGSASEAGTGEGRRVPRAGAELVSRTTSTRPANSLERLGLYTTC